MEIIPGMPEKKCFSAGGEVIVSFGFLDHVVYVSIEL